MHADVVVGMMFIYLHEGEFLPVAADKIVTYRTISLEGDLSHWHGYIAAGLLNWSNFAQITNNKRRVAYPMTLGRIYDYKIFNRGA